jgi:hypothetical protein
MDPGRSTSIGWWWATRRRDARDADVLQVGSNQRRVRSNLWSVESIDPNQGTEGYSLQTQDSRETGHWDKSNEARAMSQTNCDESPKKKKKRVQSQAPLCRCYLF